MPRLDSTAPMVAEQVTRLMSWTQLEELRPYSMDVDYDALCFDTEATVAKMIESLLPALSKPVQAADVAINFADKSQIPQFNKGAAQRWKSEMPAATSERYLREFEGYYVWRRVRQTLG